MKRYLYFNTIVATLGGFLLGFDTAVISGAEQAIQLIWDLNDLQHGFTVSIAIIGTIFGAMAGGIPSDLLGRKKTLYLVAAMYLLSALGSALAGTWSWFLLFRFIGGIAVGVSSIASPMYISEIAPAGMRGRLVALMQFSIEFGILIAYVSNYFLEGSGENTWRWMLGVESFPAFIFLSLIAFIPESPRWLVVKKADIEEAKKVFARIEPDSVEERIQHILDAHQQQVNHQGRTRLFQKKYSYPILLAVLFAIFNQVSGINGIIYYAPRIFQNAGFESNIALLSTAGIGLIKLTFTIISINLIDRFGRRFLMIIGTLGLLATLSLTSIAFFLKIGGVLVAVSLFTYIAFFGFSHGTVIWVFISEIFPNEVRARGQSLGFLVHWVTTATIAFTLPSAGTLGFGYVFGFFAVMMVFQLVFVLRIMPETKGISLEEMQQKLER